ncbi:hypothetical protein [Micromonospora sp. NPDC005220]|uniref:hypothetical protein n=1 Tax=Micromonospora sp. NPDC005220 TaxID=3155589 RepID=UPI0033A3A078
MVGLVFEEPRIAREGGISPAEPTVNWFLECTRPQAAQGRRIINEMYSRFPDRDGRLHAELRAPDDTRLYSALDELLVHDLLSRRYRVSYEEGSGTRPDFRLYAADGSYVGAVEVLTLTLREDWTTEQRRHAVLVDDLNARLTLTTHSITVEIRRWDRAPRMRPLVAWIDKTIAQLRDNPGALPVEDGVPGTMYRSAAVDIDVRFLALPAGYRICADDDIVVNSAAIGGLVDSAARLRQRLEDKAVKYELRDKPFAVVAGIRDSMCDIRDVHEALTGTSAIQISSGAMIRKGDGFFGTGRDRTAGKHQRVSAVFSVHEWFPGGPYRPRITRFDNPLASYAFPADAMPCGGHWGVTEQTQQCVRADWLTPAQAMLPA